MIMVTACTRIETAFLPDLGTHPVVRMPMGNAASDWLARRLAGSRLPSVILSTGFCGGLDPDLSPGDLVLASGIHDHAEILPVERSLLSRTQAALTNARIPYAVGLIESATEVVKEAAVKKRLRETGAIAVDMESGPLARLARSSNIGFVSLRAVLDPAFQTLPFSAHGFLPFAILMHPLVTLHIAFQSVRAARAIGGAIPAVVQVLGGEAA